MNIVWTMIGVYSLDDPTLNAEGHEYHLNEYINRFCMHATVPWHTVDNIFIPVNVKDRDHWVLVVLSFSERYIFIYDSYEFFDHYAVVLAEIEKLAKIIPLCLKACNFYKNKDIDLDNHPRYKDKDMLDLFDVLFVDDLPQQTSESLSFRRSFELQRQYYFTKYGDILIEHYQDIPSKGKSILEFDRKVSQSSVSDKSVSQYLSVSSEFSLQSRGTGSRVSSVIQSQPAAVTIAILYSAQVQISVKRLACGPLGHKHRVMSRDGISGYYI
ncbi:hypothetical protein BC332_30268 [Capsicum chinense]|nr:hypothetical protein BC332_30268 [Capsicum chinense]